MEMVGPDGIDPQYGGADGDGDGDGDGGVCDDRRGELSVTR